MPRAGICLEVVNVSRDPPATVDEVWIDPHRAASLLDMMAIDTSSPQYLAVDARSAPDFSWWWVKYERCRDATSARPDAGISPYPPKEYCQDPATLLGALEWLRGALSADGLLKREQFWAWFDRSVLYDAARFPEPFLPDLGSWIALCERADAMGMKVALRVGE